MLARLHEVGCQRDKAGNRQLHMDEYCLLVLLFLFNPVARSLRALQQASELRKVQRKLGSLRASLGSLSEATEVFEPERLKEIIAELGAQLEPVARDPRLKDVRGVVTLVDGTLLKGLPVLVQAALEAEKFLAEHRQDAGRDMTAPLDYGAEGPQDAAEEAGVPARLIPPEPVARDPGRIASVLPILQVREGQGWTFPNRGSSRRAKVPPDVPAAEDGPCRCNSRTLPLSPNFTSPTTVPRS
jgi:hypothetical protein